MSLFRQLWLAVIGLTIFAFVGSILVSVLTSRNYLQEQLTLKNIDNASSLALALTQLPQKDAVTVDLLVSAQFDTGHYQLIKLVDPNRKVIVEKHYTGKDNGVPAWFIRLFPIQATAGFAQIQDGWKQYGTIQVVSHSRYAYQELWRGTMGLLAWFLAAGLVAGAIGTVIMRLIVRPLNQVVDQAQAISERRFIAIEEPRTPELRSVVSAMNGMVERLRFMFAEEANRLEGLRRKVNHDPVTGLPNRELFMNRLNEALSSEECAATGVMLLVRLTKLEEINTRFGHGMADTILREIATVIEQLCTGHGNCIAARTKGSDFAMLVPNAEPASTLAEKLAVELHRQVASKLPQLDDHFHVGAVRYHRGEGVGTLLAAADHALATAEGRGPNTWYSSEEEEEQPIALSGVAWRKLLSDAVSEQRLKLALFPVISATGESLHREGAARLQPERDGPWLAAIDFMPMATRLKLTSSLDLEIVRLALQDLRASTGDMAVNLSADTIADWTFRNNLTSLLSPHPDLCRRLWVEVPEFGVFRQLEAFRDLCRTLKGLGCRVGIEHFGQRFGEISKLADLGLDYLKVDSNFIRGIDQNPGNQEFLAGFCKIARAVGISVIAEGVQTEQELSSLHGLGFDGATGPAISRQSGTV